MMKPIFTVSLLIAAAAIMASGERRGREFLPRIHVSNPLSGGGDMSAGDTARRTDDQSVLLRMEREWNEALKARDVAWFERNLADDVTDTSSGNGALHTKGEDSAALKADRTVYESLELSDLKARVEGNAGVVTGVNHLKGHDEQGQTFDVRLSFTDTYIRRNGRWQVWASQHTRVRP
jgi:ketosteroid isomerase-like protein